MNADAIAGAPGLHAAGSREPFYFDSGDHRLFGWLHRPEAQARSGWGVVLCSPFGFEAVCAHRSLRAFAEAAAALGMPALRFDYLGTGDSADIDPASDQIETWSADIASAVATLRRRTGVQRVCLIGFRLGALLASRAAKRCKVEALAMIGPVLSGARYLREARTAQLAAAAAAVAAGGEPSQPAPAGRDGLEIAGFRLSAASVASLSALDAPPEMLPDLIEMLLIDRDDVPLALSWTQARRRSGLKIWYQALPGFVEMMMRDPQFATLPQQLLTATCDWLGVLPGVTAAAMLPGEQASRDACVETHGDELSLASEADPAEARIRERPVFFAAEPPRFGIVTEPRRNEPRHRAVILVNAGATYHIGANRTYVSLARRWARRGYYVLRMDLSGLGDSDVLPGGRDNEVFPQSALEDIAAAIEFMRERYGIRDLTLSGLCSGAYHTLRAGAAGLDVQRLVMVNAQNYFWDSRTMSLEGLQVGEIVSNPSIYRERIFSAAAWWRFLTGRVNIWRIVLIYVHRPLLAVQAFVRDMARALGLTLRHDLGRDLESIVGRGVRVVFVFARGEPGIDLLQLEAGSTLKKLGDRCRIRVIDSADHIFSRSDSRKVLEEVLSEELFAR